MMNPKVKEKWLVALRSGLYQQCKSRLTDGTGFCCLGVLTNIYALENGIMWERVAGEITLHGEEAVLPQEVALWADLDEPNPCPDGFRSLAALNDHVGLDFSKIADAIEKGL